MQKIYEILNNKFYSESGHKKRSLKQIKMLCHFISLFFATFAAAVLFQKLDIPSTLSLFFGFTLALVLEVIIFRSGCSALLTLAELIKGGSINDVETEARRINAFFRGFMAFIYITAFVASAVLTITGAGDKASELVEIPPSLSQDSLNQIVNSRFDSAMNASLALEISSFERLSKKDSNLLAQIESKDKQVQKSLASWNRCVRKNGKARCWGKHSAYRNNKIQLDKLTDAQASNENLLSISQTALNTAKQDFKNTNYEQFNSFATDQISERESLRSESTSKQRRYNGWARFTGVIAQSFILLLEVLLLLIPMGNGVVELKEPGYLESYSPLVNFYRVFKQRQKIKWAVRIANYSNKSIKVGKQIIDPKDVVKL